MEPFLPSGQFGVKNVTNCRKRWVMAAAFLFILKYPGPISSLSDRHVKKKKKTTEKVAAHAKQTVPMRRP